MPRTVKTAFELELLRKLLREYYEGSWLALAADLGAAKETVRQWLVGEVAPTAYYRWRILRLAELLGAK